MKAASTVFGVLLTIFALVMALVFGDAWWWGLFAISALIDIVNIALLVAVGRKKNQIAAEQYRATMMPPRPQETAKAEEPAAPAPRVAEPPQMIDGKTIAYDYPDVEIEPDKSGVQRSRVGDPVTFGEVDGRLHVYQNDLHLGSLAENRLAAMIRDWEKDGNPYRAVLSHAAWTGTRAQLRLTFYRDELARIRAKKNAFVTRLNAVTDYVSDELAGKICSAEWDEERGRYNVMCEFLQIGCLPVSAVDKIRALDREPEDMDIRVDHTEIREDAAKYDCFVVIS